MNETTNNTFDEDEVPYTFRILGKQITQKIKNSIKSWTLIVIVTIVGMLSGLVYAFIKPITYTARVSFVVEDAKGSGGSIVSALAGQIGIDIGSLTGGSSVLSGDNVLELLKSKTFIKKTLLTAYDSSNRTSLADVYANTYKLKQKWKNSKEVAKEISFHPNNQNLSRLEDSLLQTIIKNISDKELSVIKPDKKLSIFEINTDMRDEKLSALFCERLLNITTDFYVDAKIGRLKRNVDKLQKRADSIGSLLNKQTYASLEESKVLLDINPAYTTSTINSEISNRNKIMLSTIYGEIVKNLEISKTALIQETPTIEIIDEPEFPLKINRLKWYKGLILGGIIGVGLFFAWVIFFTPSKHQS